MVVADEYRSEFWGLILIFLMCLLISIGTEIVQAFNLFKDEIIQQIVNLSFAIILLIVLWVFTNRERIPLRLPASFPLPIHRIASLLC